MAEIDAARGSPKIKLFGATIPVVERSDEGRKPPVDDDPATEKTLTKPKRAFLPCPRCKSTETKFCYFNNYNVNQPRHFCKGCQRYWTAGGTLRNVPFGAGRRKAKLSGHAAATIVGFDGDCVLGQSEVRELGLEGVVEEWSTRVSAAGGPAKRRNGVAYAQIP